MEKRGQLTVFIIIGLIVIFIMALLISTMKPKEKIRPVVIDSISPVVEDCIKDVGTDGAKLLAQQGGMLHPVHTINSFFMDFTYLYYDDFPLLPKIEEMEFDLSDYINENLANCLNFSYLEEQGHSVNYGETNTTTIIADEEVIFKVNIPIKVIMGDMTFTKSDFATKIPIRLGHIYNIVKELISDIIEEPDYISVDKLVSFDVNITSYPEDADSIIYKIEDEKPSSVYGVPYIFLFAVFHNTSLPNHPPRFVNLKDFEIRVGNEFFYDIDAVDPETDEITYSASTTLFDIGPVSGIIQFTPGEFEVGEHTVTLFAKDSKGAVSYGRITLKITK